MKVSIIGSGNVAWHFAKRLSGKVEQLEIVHRTTLSDSFSEVDFTSSTELTPTSDLTIIAVSDRAIKEVIANLCQEQNLVVHTSGSVGLDVFESTQIDNYGVLYPLQSLTTGIETKEIPLLIEGSSKRAIDALQMASQLISSVVRQVDSLERKRIHAAAIFSSNFVNQLMSISEEVLKDIPLSILKPLVENTVKKAFEVGPTNAQTGPAIRNDVGTMNAHLAILENDLQRDLYSLISKYIHKAHNS